MLGTAAPPDLPRLTQYPAHPPNLPSVWSAHSMYTLGEQMDSLPVEKRRVRGWESDPPLLCSLPKRCGGDWEGAKGCRVMGVSVGCRRMGKQ